MSKPGHEFFFVIIILFFGFNANAGNYYLSTTGNDINAGTSPGTAWKTIEKLNSSFSLIKAGDSILFKRGDIFYGSIVVSKSGTPVLPIVISAYGAGAKPIITGFKTINSWKNLKNNIWESASEVFGSSTCNMVVINGVNTPMGRYPNTGYLTYQSSTKSSITSFSLKSSHINWTGATAVIRKNNWITDRDTIIAQSGGTLTHTAHSIYKGIDNYGFFIQNDSRTLDQQNEWFYNSSTKKLQIYSTSLPTNIYVPTIDTLVNINGSDNIVFSDISFKGSNEATFVIRYSSHVSIINCNIDFSGVNAIITRGGKCDFFKFINSKINHTNNNAIDLGGKSPNCLIRNAIIKNTGILAGMGLSADGNYIGIQVGSDNTIVENCIIDSTGYNGICFYGNNTIIKNNLVSNFCMTKFDGGGLYTFISIKGEPAKGQQLLNNIVINGKGDAVGTTQVIPLVHGIYLDEGTSHVEIAGNTVANNSYSGIYYHSSYNNNVHDNTVYNNGYSQLLIACYNPVRPDRNLKLKNNIFVSRTFFQKTASFQSGVNDIARFGAKANVDSNYYARPINDNTTIETSINNYKKTQMTLSAWTAYSGFDTHSYKSPKVITDVNNLIFEYNATSLPVTKTLDGNYIDVANTKYNRTITIDPYSSVVLLKN
jgi:parallel beta-helix repeat protein